MTKSYGHGHTKEVGDSTRRRIKVMNTLSGRQCVDVNVQSVEHAGNNISIQAGRKTELPPRTAKPTKQSTTSVIRRITDTVEVQRRRGLLASGVTALRSSYRRSKLVRGNGRDNPGRPGRPQPLIGGDGRERLLCRRTGLGDYPGWGWSSIVSVSRVPRSSGPIPNGGWFLALQVSRLIVQVFTSIHRQLGMHVFRVQRLDPDGWSRCLSWSCKCWLD